MKTPASSFKLPVNTSEGGKQSPIRPFLEVDHAFAPYQQRLTLGRPEGTHQILVDLWEPGLMLRWSDKSMADLGPKAFGGMGDAPALVNSLLIQPDLPRGWKRSWYRRKDGMLPILEMRYEGPDARLDLEALDGINAGIVRITLTPGVGASPRLLVDVFADHACSAEGALFRLEDQIHCFLAEPLPPWSESFKLGPLADLSPIKLLRGKGASCRHYHRSIGIDLAAEGSPKTVWVIIPHHANSEELTSLRAYDWPMEWERAIAEWRTLMARAVRFDVGDEAAGEAYYAALADNFLLREQIGDGHIGVTCGTGGFRSMLPMVGNTLANIATMLRAGFSQQAWSVAETYLKLQEDSGRVDCIHGSKWFDRVYWSHGCFGLAYMEYYRFTRDRGRLQNAWPHLVRLARWAASERRQSKTRAPDDLRHGLMPPGKGDGGISDILRLTGSPGEVDSPTHPFDYGVYYPHNIWNVIGLRCIRDLSREFGSSEEQAELEVEFEDAWQCLKRSIDKVAVASGRGLWIPATPEHDGGSFWSRLQVAYPGELVPYEHPWVIGALHKLEENRGVCGLPRYMGWASLGVWAGGVIEQPGPVYLRRGEVDKLSDTLYSILNIASPVWTWTSDRQGGAATGLSDTRGLQESYPTLFFTWLFRDLFLYEKESELHLAAGIPRHWYAAGRPIGASDAPSYFGTVTYRIEADLKNGSVNVRGAVANTTSDLGTVVVHLNLPEKRSIGRITQASPQGIRLQGDTVAVPPSREFSFVAELE